MTFYDDAEIAAVEILRRAAEEDGGPSRSKEMADLVVQFYSQHGSDGIHALVIALARWNTIAFSALAEQQGIPLDQFLDQWEMHKLIQHTDEDEDDEPADLNWWPDGTEDGDEPGDGAP